MAANGRKHSGADKSERQADAISCAAVRFDAIEHRDGGAQGGDLRQRQIDEDHAALHHVDAQIGVNAGQNQARDERREQERKCIHLCIYRHSYFVVLNNLTSRLMS